MHSDRGKIYNHERARQQRDYSGLRFGNITPTDIDGIIEYKNIGYVIIELKYSDNVLPYGQKLALERLTDDLEKAGKPCLCIVATHLTLNCNEDIDVASALVEEYRYKEQWRENKNSLATKELIERFFKRLERQ